MYILVAPSLSLSSSNETSQYSYINNSTKIGPLSTTAVDGAVDDDDDNAPELQALLSCLLLVPSLCPVSASRSPVLFPDTTTLALSGSLSRCCYRWPNLGQPWSEAGKQYSQYIARLVSSVVGRSGGSARSRRLFGLQAGLRHRCILFILPVILYRALLPAVSVHI